MKRIVKSDRFASNLRFLVGVLGVGSEAYKDAFAYNALMDPGVHDGVCVYITCYRSHRDMICLA